MLQMTQLYGFGVLKGGAGPSTMTFVDSATSTAATITIPSGASIGDFAILFDYATQGTEVTEVVPTGWTQIGTALGSIGKSVVSYKVLQSGDPGASITGMDGSTSDAKVMFVFTPNAAISTVTPSTWNAQLTNANPGAQSVTASGQPTPLIVFGMTAVQTNVATTFSTASPAFDGEVAIATRLRAGYKIYNSSPADHTIDMDDLGAGNQLRSGYVQFS